MTTEGAGSPSYRLLAWLRGPIAAPWFPRGAGAAGALYLLGVSALFLSGPIVDPDEPAASVIADLVRSRFADEIARITVILTAATLLAGAALGLLAGLLIAARERARSLPPRSRLRLAATLIGLIVVEHFLFVAWSMATHPQLYAASFYDRGGWRRALQLLVSDRLTPGAIAAGSALAGLAFVLGWPTAWARSASRLVGWVRTHPIHAGALLLCAAVALAWPVRLGRSSIRPGAGGGRVNVIVLASDGVRADRLRPEIAPRLSALADRGTRFDRAYATVPRTFSSWMTILTGRHAHHHGVRSTCDPWANRAKFFDALPDRFAAAGYRTAVVSDFAGDIFGRVPVGFQDIHVPRNDFRQMLQNRGFERDLPLLPFLDTPTGRSAFPSIKAADSLTDPRRVANDAIREIRGFAGSPFFLTVFFSTTHFPYAAPYPYYRRFTDPEYRGVFKYGRPVGLSAAPVMKEADQRQARALYDGAVASVDEAVGSILDELARDHLDERTIIVVTSDHGENLFEQRPEFGALFGGHGEHLFGDEGTHVPLVVFDPRQKPPHREAAVVSSVDIAPTIYDLASVPPPADMDGRSLAAAVGGVPMESAPAFAETELWITDPFLPEALRVPCPPAAGLLTVDEAHGDEIVIRPDMENLTLVARHRMVRDDRWKLVYMPTRAGVAYALFDTASDPGERSDVFAREPAQAQRLEQILWRWMLDDPRMMEQRGYLLPRRASEKEGP